MYAYPKNRKLKKDEGRRGNRTTKEKFQGKSREAKWYHEIVGTRDDQGRLSESATTEQEPRSQ